jgi:ribosomal protein S1
MRCLSFVSTCPYRFLSVPRLFYGVKKRNNLYDKTTTFRLYSVLDTTERVPKPNRKQDNTIRKKAPQATIKLEQLVVGQQLTAKILKTKAYGCFVDIGIGQDVLVHISELSTQFVKNIAETISVGDTIKVYVKSIDLESRKVWLTTLQHRTFVSHRKPVAQVEVEDIVKGNVVRLTESGAFVDFGCFCDGFLPFTEVPPENNNLALGDEVEARVIRVEQTTRKIWLSIRQVDIKVRQLIRPPLQLVLERPTKQPQEKTTSETTDEDEFVRQQQQQPS